MRVLSLLHSFLASTLFFTPPTSANPVECKTRKIEKSKKKDGCKMYKCIVDNSKLQGYTVKEIEPQVSK